LADNLGNSADFDHPGCSLAKRCIATLPMDNLETAFTEDEQHTFYLEILGDAQDQDPFLYEPLFCSRTRFPKAPEGARRALARTTLLRLFEESFIDLFEMEADVPIDRRDARAILDAAPWESNTGPEHVFAD
jgi:hypothetical protein